jgi:hypothetical protein
MSQNNNSNNTNGLNNASNNTTNDLEAVDGALAELKSQYDDLVKTIQTKYDEQQQIFQKMASSDYQGDDYNADRINHLIEENVNNLKQQRDNIWKYLTNVYNKNTQQTYRNLKSMKSNEKHIEINKQKKEELKNKLIDLQGDNNRQKKLIKYNMYHHKTVYNKFYGQFILMIALVFCVGMMYLTEHNYVSSMVGYGSIIIVAIIAILYNIYLIYIHRMNRDKFQWHKTTYSRIDPSQETNDNNVDNEGDVNYAELDKQAKTEFAKHKQSCSKN